MVTASIRRISLEGYTESLVDLLGDDFSLLPNTAGCETVRDAVLTAQLAREALDTDWVKLELIGDRETLYPDVVQLVEAADTLTKDGFKVLPYCNDDPIVCRRLGRGRLCCGHAPGRADRFGQGHCQPLQHRDHSR